MVKVALNEYHLIYTKLFLYGLNLFFYFYLIRLLKI